METIDIVSLIESNPITRLSQTYNNKLLTKIKTSFTEQQQQLFVASFYCYLNYNQTADFIIDLDNVWNWMGFSQKIRAKNLLEKHFILDKDYKCLHAQSGEQKNVQGGHNKETTSLLSQPREQKNGRGGHNKETILLTIQTFKLFCIKAATKKATEIHEYFIKLEQIIQETVHEESNELRLQLEKQKEESKQKDEELKKQQEEIKKLQETKGKQPTIYIYNTDITQKNAPLKIGMSHIVNERTKQFKTTHPNGKFALKQVIPGDDANLRTFERYIHDKFKNFRIQGEVFRIDQEEAIVSVMTDALLYNLYNNTNDIERKQQMLMIYESVNSIIHKVAKPTNEIACQTDIPMQSIDDDSSLNSTVSTQDTIFDDFIRDHCIVRNDVDVSAKKIIGLFRIIKRNKRREISAAFTEYLKKRFVYGKVKNQDKNQVIYGFSGVMLKEILYKKSQITCDEETFVFEKCSFTPDGTVSYKELVDEFIEWKNNVQKPITGEEHKTLKKYLDASPHVMYDTVNTPEHGSCRGYYGLINKKYIHIARKNTTTAKSIQKCDMNDNILLVYESIAKTAESEKVCSAKISRAIKNKTIFENEVGEKYYYCTAVPTTN